MPEFTLDHGTKESAEIFASLDSFTQGYIEAMFFTEDEQLCNDSDDWESPSVAVNRDTMESRFVGGDVPSFADLAPSALDSIIRDCAKFQQINSDLLNDVYGVTGKYDESRAGNDYWYTRNGHGTGFWDRGLGDAGDALANAARYSEKYLYCGNDGLLYLD